MSLYSIGEVARICGINPVTLRAWQRRYGLLKPQRTEGGHRLFDDNDLETIRTIIGWINRGVQVSQVKALLEGNEAPVANGWVQIEQKLLLVLQEDKTQKVRQLILELGREYPAENLINHVVRPLRTRLSANISTSYLLGVLDGILIEHAVMSMAAARKKPGVKVLLAGWGEIDRTELWLEAIVLSHQGKHIDLLPEPLADPHFENVKAERILLWAEGRMTRAHYSKYLNWQQVGLPVELLGSAAMLLQSAADEESAAHSAEEGDPHDKYLT
ncbi:MerR family transcriptional regulator [Rouxiella sp. WC2420]|uniref:MerR family transcriptional regulator n=1 Tax=Rouxiella sp. WC2420 TaxID=3234145 RepID=A0AB39VLY8_9GAMM